MLHLPIEPPEISWLDAPGGDRIACRMRAGGSPTLMFLPGYASDMEGAKAVALDGFAAERGLAMIRFDYSGTGASGGSFDTATLSLWLDQALALVDSATDGPLILIGSSMGGWLALHMALRRPARVAALVGIAAAPDFTDWGFSADDKAELARSGKLERGDPDSPQLVKRGFWQSGQAMRLLDGPIDIECPVRLIHGDSDQDVPLAVANKLIERLRSADVQLTSIKDGGHRLSEPHEIAKILRTVAELLELES